MRHEKRVALPTALFAHSHAYQSRCPPRTTPRHHVIAVGKPLSPCFDIGWRRLQPRPQHVDHGNDLERCATLMHTTVVDLAHGYLSIAPNTGAIQGYHPLQPR